MWLVPHIPHILLSEKDISQIAEYEPDRFTQSEGNFISLPGISYKKLVRMSLFFSFNKISRWMASLSAVKKKMT